LRREVEFGFQSYLDAWASVPGSVTEVKRGSVRPIRPSGRFRSSARRGVLPAGRKRFERTPARSGAWPEAPDNTTTPQEHQPSNPHETLICGVVVFFLTNREKEYGALPGTGAGEQAMRVRSRGAVENTTTPQIKVSSALEGDPRTPRMVF